MCRRQDQDRGWSPRAGESVSVRDSRPGCIHADEGTSGRQVGTKKLASILGQESETARFGRESGGRQGRFSCGCYVAVIRPCGCYVAVIGVGK